MLREILGHRDLLWLLTLREIRIRYARAALGAAWAVFGPLVTLVLFTYLDFARLIPDGSRWESLPYPVFAFVGVVFWVQFSTAVTQGTPSLVVASDILRKSAFPREVIPLAKTLATVFDLGIGMVILGLFLVVNGIPLRPSAVAVPIILFIQLLLAAGCVLFLSALNLFYRDVNYLVQVLIVLAMFATSVVYPITVSNPTAAFVLQLNPMTAILDSYRECLLLGSWPFRTLFPAVLWAVAMAVVGASTFRTLSHRFAEEV